MREFYGVVPALDSGQRLFESAVLDIHVIAIAPLEVHRERR